MTRSYFMESTAFPWDIAYCNAEDCARTDCVRHLCNVNRTKNVTYHETILYTVAELGNVCSDYTLEEKNES